MKTLTEYICNESKTADFIVAVADCVKDPKNVTDSDVKTVQAMLKKDYSMDTNDTQAKDLIELMIKDWPELFFEE